MNIPVDPHTSACPVRSCLNYFTVSSANEQIQKLETFLVSQQDMLNLICLKNPIIPGTRMVHFVDKVIDVNKVVTVKLYQQSQFESHKGTPFCTQVYGDDVGLPDQDISGTSMPQKIDWKIWDWIHILYDSEVFPGLLHRVICSIVLLFFSFA